jgi:TP901 family phage tail tape measure protein
MSRDLTLAMKLYADASRMLQGLVTGERGINKFTRNAKAHFDSFKNSITSVEGKLASLGVTIGVTATIMQSANLDKDLKQLQLTAGASADEAARLRKELFSAQNNYGQGVDKLKDGVDALVAGGLSLKQSTATVEPMAQTLAVAKTNATALAQAMGVASKQFNIDLSDTQQATYLLDRMVVAGRAGNAELENLPDVFARVGANAKTAKLDLNQTLALVETLSLVEPDPNRLGTLVDSTLRVFTNMNYMKNAQKATGVKFFDASGSRRDALMVLNDIDKKYKSLSTDVQKNSLIAKAFGAADADTIKGLRELLDEGKLSALDKVLLGIINSGGTVKRDVDEAISNSVDQAGRLKGVLREAADGFAQPINDSITKIIKLTLDPKEKGGLGMDGQDMMLAGGGALVAGALTMKAGRKLLSGLGTGVATGKALEEAAGVTPVYVVNMPDMGIAGMPTAPGTNKGGGLGKYGKYALGAGSFLMSAPFGAMAAGAMGGYGAGKLLYDNVLEGTVVADAIGRSIAMAMAPFSSTAREAFAADLNARTSELSGTLKVELNDNRPPKVSLTTNQPGMKVNMSNGPLMLGN